MTDLKSCPFCETEVFADEDSASALAGMIAAWNRRYPSEALIKAREVLEWIVRDSVIDPVSNRGNLWAAANDALTEIKKLGGE